MNLCVTLKPGKDSGTDLVPNDWIDDPLAAWSTEEGAPLLWAGDAGNTETSAPLSTKKRRRWRRQNTESAPSWEEEEEREEIAGVEGVPGVTVDSRPWSFPRPKQEWLDAGR